MDMISVSNLTRSFPGVRAVSDISFSVAQGEVVGFLGPNGAGKTTTLRMLSGFLPPTSGEVRVAGYPVCSEPMEVRSRIGYLPENCPLYPDMRVDEYLRFRAALKKVPGRRVRSRVQSVKEQCGLSDMGRRIIGRLSKGYRQRVGMADALVHEPALLILDEPTIGLDPSQVREVRRLIRDLAQRHTILLSTHILPEVEMTCRRVLIIHRGKMVASDTTDRLRSLAAGRGMVRLEVEASKTDVEAAFRTVPNVEECSAEPLDDGWVSVSLRISGRDDMRPVLVDSVVRAGWRLRELRQDRHSLEDVFMAIIGKEEQEQAE